MNKAQLKEYAQARAVSNAIIGAVYEGKPVPGRRYLLWSEFDPDSFDEDDWFEVKVVFGDRNYGAFESVNTWDDIESPRDLIDRVCELGLEALMGELEPMRPFGEPGHFLGCTHAVIFDVFDNEIEIILLRKGEPCPQS